MTYATLSDLIDRAGEYEILQVADRDDSGAPDETVVAKALSDADNIINGYVASKYDLPFVEVPDLLSTWSTSIARYLLHRDGAPEHIEADYKDALSGLKDVSFGRIALTGVSGATQDQASGTHLSSAPDQVFTDHELRGWK